MRRPLAAHRILNFLYKAGLWRWSWYRDRQCVSDAMIACQPPIPLPRGRLVFSDENDYEGHFEPYEKD